MYLCFTRLIKDTLSDKLNQIYNLLSKNLLKYTFLTQLSNQHFLPIAWSRIRHTVSEFGGHAYGLGHVFGHACPPNSSRYALISYQYVRISYERSNDRCQK